MDDIRNCNSINLSLGISPCASLPAHLSLRISRCASLHASPRLLDAAHLRMRVHVHLASTLINWWCFRVSCILSSSATSRRRDPPPDVLSTSRHSCCHKTVLHSSGCSLPVLQQCLAEGTLLPIIRTSHKIISRKRTSDLSDKAETDFKSVSALWNAGTDFLRYQIEKRSCTTRESPHQSNDYIVARNQLPLRTRDKSYDRRFILCLSFEDTGPTASECNQRFTPPKRKIDHGGRAPHPRRPPAANGRDNGQTN